MPRLNLKERTLELKLACFGSSDAKLGDRLAELEGAFASGRGGPRAEQISEDGNLFVAKWSPTGESQQGSEVDASVWARATGAGPGATRALLDDADAIVLVLGGDAEGAGDDRRTIRELADALAARGSSLGRASVFVLLDGALTAGDATALLEAAGAPRSPIVEIPDLQTPGLVAAVTRASAGVLASFREASKPARPAPTAAQRLEATEQRIAALVAERDRLSERLDALERARAEAPSPAAVFVEPPAPAPAKEPDPGGERRVRDLAARIEALEGAGAAAPASWTAALRARIGEVLPRWIQALRDGH